MPLVLRAFRSMLCLILLRSLFLLCLFTPVTPLAFFFVSAQADSESSSWLGRATDHRGNPRSHQSRTSCRPSSKQCLIFEVALVKRLVANVILLQDEPQRQCPGVLELPDVVLQMEFDVLHELGR